MATSRPQASMLAQLLLVAAAHALRADLLQSDPVRSLHLQKRLVFRTGAALSPPDRGTGIGNRQAAGGLHCVCPCGVSSKVMGARIRAPALMASREPAEAPRWFIDVPKTVVDAADQAARSALNAARAGRRQMLVEASLPEFEPGTPQFRFIDVLTLARQVGLSLLSDSSLLPASRPRVKLLFGGLSDATMAGGVIQYNNLPVSLLGAASAMEPTDGAFIIVMPRAASPREMQITEAQVSDTLNQAGSRMVVLINPRIGASDLLGRLELAYFLRPLTVSYVPSGSSAAERGLVCQLRCFPHEWTVLVDPSMEGAWEYAGRFDQCPAPVQVEAMVRDAMARSQMNRMSEEINRAKAEERAAKEQKEQKETEATVGAGSHVHAEVVVQREEQTALRTESNENQAAAKKTGKAAEERARASVATKEITGEAGKESANEGEKRVAKEQGDAEAKKTGVKAKNVAANEVAEESAVNTAAVKMAAVKKAVVKKAAVKKTAVKKENKAKAPNKEAKSTKTGEVRAAEVEEAEGKVDAEAKAAPTTKARKSGASAKSDKSDADRS